MPTSLAADLVTLTLEAVVLKPAANDCKFFSVDPPGLRRYTEAVMPGVEYAGDLGNGV